jgi:hypothetical protein
MKSRPVFRALVVVGLAAFNKAAADRALALLAGIK